MFSLDIELRRAYAGRRFLGGGTFPPTKALLRNHKEDGPGCGPCQMFWKSSSESAGLSGGFPTVLQSRRQQGWTALELLYLLKGTVAWDGFLS